MRHKKSYRKLGRLSDHRSALLRNLSTSFIRSGKVVTTLAKAKELKPVVEKIITTGKRADLAARRKVAGYLYCRDSYSKVFGELKERFDARAGGYTRIIKHGPRKGDGAEMCSLELVDYLDFEGKVRNEELMKKKKAEQENSESQGE